MRYELNQFKVFWRGDDRHAMIFGYVLPDSTLMRVVLETSSTTDQLKRFITLINEAESVSHEPVRLADKDMELELPLLFAFQIRAQLQCHLLQLERGPLEAYAEGYQLPFSDS